MGDWAFISRNGAHDYFLWLFYPQISVNSKQGNLCFQEFAFHLKITVETVVL